MTQPDLPRSVTPEALAEALRALGIDRADVTTVEIRPLRDRYGVVYVQRRYRDPDGRTVPAFLPYQDSSESVLEQSFEIQVAKVP